MRKSFFRAGLPLVTLALALLLVHFRASGQESISADPIFGTWKMDTSKSYSRRTDEQPTFSTQHMRILEPDGDDGFRNTLINDPSKPPNYSYTAKLDGKEYPDPRARGNDKTRTLVHWRLSPYVIVRLAKTNGQPTEWAIYAVSSDGKVFTSISWLPANPELQDFQVFTRGN